MLGLKTIGRKALDIHLRLMPDWMKEYLIASEEQDVLISRDARYEKITNILNIASMFNPIARLFPGRPVGIAPGAFVAYHFFRIIDDIADGERELPEEYDSYAAMQAALNKAMETERYPDSNVGILLRGTVRDMREYRGADVRKKITQFLEAMGYEQHRRVHNTVSSRDELHKIYQDSFSAPQDLAFIAFGSKIRSRNIPELAEVQGRIYAVRDIAGELERGIVFIPSEVVPSGMSANELAKNYRTVPSVRTWAQEELKEGCELVDSLKRKSIGWRERRIVSFLTKGIEQYIAQADWMY